MLMFFIGMFIGTTIGILVAALCVAAKDHDPCHDCAVYLDPEGDCRQCFACERGKRDEVSPQ